MSRPYSRHYWDLVDDPRFDDIFHDDHHYATWSRLLMLHDQAWPASAALPVGVRKRSLDKLVAVGLVTLLPHGRFKVAGLDNGRAARSSHAKSAADARWNDDPTPVEPPKSPQIEPHSRTSAHEIDAPSITGSMPLQAKQAETDKQSKQGERTGYPPAGRPEDERDSLDTYHELTRFRPWGQFSGDKLRSASAEYGLAAVDAALRAEHDANGDRNTLLDRTLTRLARDADRVRVERKGRAGPTPKANGHDPAAVREVERVRAQLILDSGASGPSRAAAQRTLDRLAAEDSPPINADHPA